MNKLAFPLTIAAAMGVVTILVAPVQAASRTWVSGTGADAGTCTRAAPRLTHQIACGQTHTDGEMNCVDPGGVGTLVITKSISIVCDYTESGVLGFNASGIVINAPAGSIITLKG